MITNWVSALATIDAPLWLMGLCVHLKAVKSTIYTVLQYTSYCTNGICSIAIMPVQVQVHFVAQCLNMGHFALHTGPEMCRRQIIFFFCICICVFVLLYAAVYDGAQWPKDVPRSDNEPNSPFTDSACCLWHVTCKSHHSD